jgi:hypothetical protein
MLRTGWTEFFNDRPLDLIVAASTLPSPKPVHPHCMTLACGTKVTISIAAVEIRINQIIALMDDVIERCRHTLDATSTMIRSWVLSYHPDRFHRKPFQELQDEKSLQKYVNLWKRFLAYVYRIWAFPIWSPMEQEQVEDIYGMQISTDEHKMLSVIWKLMDPRRVSNLSNPL